MIFYFIMSCAWWLIAATTYNEPEGWFYQGIALLFTFAFLKRLVFGKDKTNSQNSITNDNR